MGKKLRKNSKKWQNPNFTLLALFFAHNSITVHFFEKRFSQEVLEFPLVLPCNFSDFFENFFFFFLEGGVKIFSPKFGKVNKKKIQKKFRN